MIEDEEEDIEGGEEMGEEEGGSGDEEGRSESDYGGSQTWTEMEVEAREAGKRGWLDDWSEDEEAETRRRNLCFCGGCFAGFVITTVFLLSIWYYIWGKYFM